MGKDRQKVGVKTSEGRKKTSRECKKHRKGAVDRQGGTKRQASRCQNI